MLEITPDLLLQAYRIGVFPMGESRDDPKLYWLDPRLRAVLPLSVFGAVGTMVFPLFPPVPPIWEKFRAGVCVCVRVCAGTCMLEPGGTGGTGGTGAFLLAFPFPPCAGSRGNGENGSACGFEDMSLTRV